MLGKLLEKEIISEGEKEQVEEKDEELSRRRFLDFPEYDWGRLRSEQQAIKSNRKLMEILGQKSCDKIEIFLTCLMDNNQEHLANVIRAGT